MIAHSLPIIRYEGFAVLHLQRTFNNFKVGCRFCREWFRFVFGGVY